jgi:pantothenate kinase
VGSHLAFSPYRTFSREEWAKLRADTPMTLVLRDLQQLSGVVEDLSMDEVEQIYLPLSRGYSTCMWRQRRSCIPQLAAFSAGRTDMFLISLALPVRPP